MNDATQKTSISDELGANIPYLRRFARAMTGSQTSGDPFAAAALEAILMETGGEGTAETPTPAAAEQDSNIGENELYSL